MDQRLVTRKNRKMRELRAHHPGIDVTLIYQRDYQQLLVKYGLEPPEQHASRFAAASAQDPVGLLGLHADPAVVDFGDGHSVA